MKTRTLMLLLQCCCVAVLPLAAQINRTTIFPDEDALTPENLKLVWPATPGLRYEVKQSTNLQSWSTAPGYPATANGPAQQMPFLTEGDARFFQVRELDEQPPGIVNQYPQDGGFAVPRFADLTIQLFDVTGINTNSIRLTVGSLGTFALTNAQLTLSNGVLTFINGGSIPLGTWGTNVLATLVAADTLGHTGTNSWNFTLEIQPQVVTNLFVFGSPQAQRTGQRIGNIPTAVLAARFVPVPMGDGDPWTLELVETNRLVLSYTNTAPGFATDMYVCNLTPVRPEDIFNRKITAISDDPGNKRLTLFTVEVPMEEMVTNGTTSMNADSVILEMGTNGAFARAFSIGGTVTFPQIGYSLDGTELSLKEHSSQLDIVRFTAEELHWWLTPSIQGSIEVTGGGLRRFEAIAHGHVSSAAILDVDFLLAGLAIETNIFDLPEHLEPKTWLFLGSIGPFPVFASLGLDVKVKARAEVHADVSFRGGFRQSADAKFGLTYNAPDVTWVHDFVLPEPEVIKPSTQITVEGSLRVSLEPTIEFLVYGMAGISAGVTPSLGAVFEIGPGQPLSGRLEADLSLDLKAAGPSFDLARQVFHTDYALNLPIWGPKIFWSFPDEPILSFIQQPQSQTVPFGSSVNFSCAVSGPGTPTYQWFNNGTVMPGQNRSSLLFPSVNYGHAGNYLVRVTAGGQTTNSAPAMLTVVSPSLQSGLVAWYPFNGNANDASGNGNNGTGTALIPASDRFGQAAHAYAFDGSTSEITVPDSPSLDLNSFTIAFWVNPGRVDTTQSLVNKMGVGEAPSVDVNYLLQFEFNRFDFSYEDANSQNHDLDSPYDIQPNRWYSVVVTHDSVTGQRAMYRDGYAVDTQTSPAIPVNQDQPVRIGWSVFGDHQHFTGMMDDLRIYNRALSASEIQQLYNLSLPPAPSGMALIPAGSFTMGDTFNEGTSDERPTHTVYVSTFYADKYEVNKSLWDAVKAYNGGNGYSYDNNGSGVVANHPVYLINWFDAVKWCNARSQKEGLTPCYYTDAGLTTVYKTGQVVPYVKWNSNGYRLPTEAEWEKAARGALAGHHYPWPSAGGSYTNHINGSKANYQNSGDPFETNTVQTAPIGFYNGSQVPLGVDMANGYGLYDMVGNVNEWCWDWYGAYSSDSQTDPKGPVTGTARVIRGGGWTATPDRVRSATRSTRPPAVAGNSDCGFRCVRGL